MTGFILLFTGRLVPITQQVGGTCVAHAISACESVYDRQISPELIADTLGIGLTGGYDITNLPQTRSGVSKLSTGTKSDYIKLFNSGPLLIGMPKGYILNGRKLPSNHQVCGVGYNNQGIIIANSYGKRWGIKGYSRIPRDKVDQIVYQTIGSGMTPSLTGIKNKYLSNII